MQKREAIAGTPEQIVIPETVMRIIQGQQRKRPEQSKFMKN